MAQRTYDGTLKFTTSRTEAQTARRGKFSITGETVSTTDIDTSTVLSDWETVNDKAVTIPRSSSTETETETETEDTTDDTESGGASV